MGNSSSKTDTEQHDEELQQAFVQLSDPRNDAAARRAAFDRLQSEYGADISGTKRYADVLAAAFAIRFQPWAAPPGGGDDAAAQRLADRIRGCIFGNAMGDAAGLATEFMTADEALAKYPEGHVFGPGSEVYPDTHRMVFPRGDWYVRMYTVPLASYPQPTHPSP